MEHQPIYNTLIVYGRDNGTQGSCVCPDDAVASTVEYYRGMGYSIVQIDRRGYCGRCHGTGSVRRSLRHNLTTCPACKGAAEWDANETPEREVQ